MVNSLAKKSKNIDVYDPYLSSLPKSINFKGNMIGKLQKYTYDCIVLVVPHSVFVEMGAEQIRRLEKKSMFFWI